MLDANSEYVRLSGHSNLKEILGRSVVEWTAEEDREKNAMAVKSCFQKGNVRNFEINYTDKKGNVTPIEINATYLSVAEIGQIITLCRDMTERKKREEVLRKSEEKNRLFIDNFVGIAYQVSHLTFKPIFFQGAVEKLTGYTSEDFISGRILWKDLILPEHLEVVSNAVIMLRDVPGFIAAEKYAVRARDGQVKWVHDIARAIRSKDGSTDYFQGAIYDITELIQMAEELQKVQKLESLGLLAGGIAHDFNNLMGGIYGFVDLANCESDKNQIGQVIDNLIINAQQAMPVGGTIDKPVSMHKGTGTFLVMDDEEVIREAVRKILSTFGYTVVCKEQGKAALEFFAAETKTTGKIRNLR